MDFTLNQYMKQFVDLISDGTFLAKPNYIQC